MAEYKLSYTAKEIDEKLGKITDEVVSGDWNQNDENASDYIKNRTHYESVSSETTTILANLEIEHESSLDNIWKYFARDFMSWDYELYHGGEEIHYTVTIGTKTIEYAGINDESGNIRVGEYESDGYLYLGDIGGGAQIEIYINPLLHGIDLSEIPSFIHVNISTEKKTTTIKQLDEKYIPEQIARKTDVMLKSVNNKQPNNYNINLSYEDLENKPFYAYEGKEPFGIFDGRMFNFPESDSKGCYFVADNFESSEVIDVVWDGAEYNELYREQGQEVEYYGDPNMVETPFYIEITYVNTSYSAKIYSKDSGSHSIEIIDMSASLIERYKPIDENFIPHTIVRTTYVDTIVGNINAALDELHNYAQALIGGGA